MAILVDLDSAVLARLGEKAKIMGISRIALVREACAAMAYQDFPVEEKVGVCWQCEHGFHKRCEDGQQAFGNGRIVKTSCGCAQCRNAATGVIR
jgi:hypothetical protein